MCVWVESMGVVVRSIDFLILLIPTPLVSTLFCSSITTFCSFLIVQGHKKMLLDGGLTLWVVQPT